MSAPPTTEKSTAKGETANTPTLSAKEAKAAQKAAKAARRAEVKDAKGVPSDTGPRPPASIRPSDAPASSSRPDESPRPPQHQPRPRGQSHSQAQRPAQIKKDTHANKPEKTLGADKKEVSLFKHLYTSGTKTVSPDVHPAVLSLGQQMATYVVCGSSARCVAMLQAFKHAIKSYTTPPETALSRHLPTYLNIQIAHLISSRPMSISMGNAIRWLKEFIGALDIDLPESSAKSHLLDSIDDFIRERITAADALIARTAAAKIKTGYTIVTYAKSHVVAKTLLHAHRDLKLHFKVIVLDSRPLFEGRNLVRVLADAGIETCYALINATSHVVPSADLCLLGAHAMMANGRLCSRIGTASVALAAHGSDVPVIALCESVKFSGRVALDSIVINEVAAADELVLGAENDPEEEGEDGETLRGLESWRNVPGLQLLNLMHDYTPAAYIDMVITEYGSLPPTSVPVVYSISTGEHQAGR